jgi:hypothetical protein
MRRIESLIACTLAAVLAAAAGPGRHVPQDPPAPQPSASSFDAELALLIERYEQAEVDFRGKWRAAKEDAERGKLWEERTKGEALFAAEFEALALRATGSEAGAKASIWVVQLAGDAPPSSDGKPGIARAALERLAGEYVRSPALAELPAHLAWGGRAIGDEAIERALGAIVAKSPHRPVVAGSLYALGMRGMSRAGDASARAEVRAHFVRLSEEFGDLSDAYERNYKQLAEGNLFELDHLQLGMVAPDFDAVDENGVAFKLSDYRGKVVVVDFWGFW